MTLLEFVILAFLLAANAQLFVYSRAAWRQFKALRQRHADQARQAMHDLLVWHACEGFTGFEEALEAAHHQGYVAAEDAAADEARWNNDD